MQWLALPPVRQHETPLHGFICSYDKHKQLTYRVLRLLKIKDKNMEIKVDMFSSDTCEWTKSLVSCPRRFDLSSFATAAVVYKDLLFWWEIKSNRIVGCDPNNYRFFELPVQMEHGIDYFGLCGGSLRICEIPGQEDPSLLRVWVLKDFVKNEDKWCLEHEVYFNQMTWKNSTWLTEYVKSPYLQVFAYHPNDGDILYLVIKSRIVLCNLQRKTLEMLHDFPMLAHVCARAHTSVLPWWPTPIPSSPLQNAT
ncbi:F-box protein At3g26010-like [Fagus crenata]